MDRLPQLYPDLAKAGGLASRLQGALREIGSELEVTTLDEQLSNYGEEVRSRFPTYARVESNQRFSQVYIAAEERLFLNDFWNRGVMLASASTPDIMATSKAIHCWVAEGATTTELASQFPFVEVQNGASAFEAGEEVEWRWKLFEQSIPRDFPELTAFFNIARRTPELRRLFPFTSLNLFCFSRCTGYPFTRDCPSVIPKAEEGYGKAMTTKYEVRLGGRLLGEGNGEEAVRLVVENLPANCGPAVAGTADESLPPSPQ